MKKLLGLILAGTAVAGTMTGCGAKSFATDSVIAKYTEEFKGWDDNGGYINGQAAIENDDSIFQSTVDFDETDYITIAQTVITTAPTTAGEIAKVSSSDWWVPAAYYLAEDGGSGLEWTATPLTTLLRSQTSYVTAYNAWIASEGANHTDAVIDVPLNTHTLSTEFELDEDVMTIDAGYRMTDVGDYFWTVATVIKPYLWYSATSQTREFALADWTGVTTMDVLASGSNYGLTNFAPYAEGTFDQEEYALTDEMLGKPYLMKVYKDTPYSSAETTPTLSIYDKDGELDSCGYPAVCAEGQEPTSWYANLVSGSEEIISLS